MANLNDKISDEVLDSILQDIVEYLDYDMYKCIYIEGYEDADEQAESQINLRNFARESIEKWT